VFERLRGEAFHLVEELEVLADGLEFSFERLLFRDLRLDLNVEFANGFAGVFGDGAGAAILKASDAPGILSTHLHTDGSYRNALCTPGTIENGKVRGSPMLQMDGRAVYKFAVKAFEEVAWEALNANAMKPDAIDWFICHQANKRIIAHAAAKLDLTDEKVVMTVDRHGNTSAASIPLALDVTVREGKIKAGDSVLLAALGGGFAWGAAMLKW